MTKKAGWANLRASTFVYCFREAALSLVRNSWMTIASIAIVAVSLIILGSSILLVFNADYLAGRLESKLEISVFLKDDLESSEITEIGKEIKVTPGVAELQFISKEAALQDIKESFGDRKEILDNLPRNPLSDAYRVKAADANQVPALAKSFERLEGVDTVRYGKGTVEKLLVITHWVRLVSLGLMGVLGVAAVFLIATTIRMSVFARRNEISIMKYLGATNWYVRAPFLIEGMVLGLIGAALAVAVVYFGYAALVNQIKVSIPFITPVAGGEVLQYVVGGLLGLGMLIGAFGSIVSVRRFLKV